VLEGRHSKERSRPSKRGKPSLVFRDEEKKDGRKGGGVDVGGAAAWKCSPQRRQGGDPIDIALRRIWEGRDGASILHKRRDGDPRF